MELKLSTGQVVQINRPSVRESDRCRDIIVPQFEIDGEKMKKISMPLSNRAWSEWAAAGLGVDVDDLYKYSKAEKEEIGLAVKEMADLSPKSESS